MERYSFMEDAVIKQPAQADDNDVDADGNNVDKLNAKNSFLCFEGLLRIKI